MTHVQNLSTPIRGFQPEYQQLMVMKTLEAISYHVLPHCATDTIDIVRVANEKRMRCKEYKAIDMSVKSLAVWHSYLGLHARWVLGVRHDKEKGARKRRYCNQDGCGNKVVQGGVCVKHGARVKRRYCNQDGCDNQVQRGGVCVKHGARVKRCSQEGCSNQVVQGGVCVKHGAITKQKTKP
jgi:hypothetical protein